MSPNWPISPSIEHLRCPAGFGRCLGHLERHEGMTFKGHSVSAEGYLSRLPREKRLSRNPMTSVNSQEKLGIFRVHLMQVYSPCTRWNAMPRHRSWLLPVWLGPMGGQERDSQPYHLGLHGRSPGLQQRPGRQWKWAVSPCKAGNVDKELYQELFQVILCFLFGNKNGRSKQNKIRAVFTTYFWVRSWSIFQQIHWSHGEA